MDIFPIIIVNSIIAGSIYALVALGFNLIYGATKFFNLAHGAMAVIGGYAVFFLAKTLGVNLFVSIAAAVFFAGAIGWSLDRFIFRPLRQKKASNMIMLVASLGVSVAIQSIIAIIFTNQFQTFDVFGSNLQAYAIFGAVITPIQIIILASVAAITLALVLLFKATTFGKAVRAISDDGEVAKIVGINTDKVIGRLFFAGSAIAGFSGILIGFDTGLEPSMGMGLLLKGVIASIVGGVGNIYGGVVGAFLLAFLENFGVWQISGEWKDAIAFCLLIVFLLFRPQGIFSSKS